jgi:Flp pilus assembly protein TadG
MKITESLNSSRPRSSTPRPRARFGLQSGQSLVELALVLPILLLLLVGIIEIGRFSYYSILVSNAARAGAQYGAQNLITAADTRADGGIVRAAKNDGENVGPLNVTAITTCGCTGTAATLGGACPATACALPDHALVYVEVTASGTFNSLFNYPGLPAAISLSSTEKMRVAQ